MEKIIKEIRFWAARLIPSVHNLPQVIYIRWMDREWYIEKRLNS